MNLVILENYVHFDLKSLLNLAYLDIDKPIRLQLIICC